MFGVGRHRWAGENLKRDQKEKRIEELEGGGNIQRKKI